VTERTPSSFRTDSNLECKSRARSGARRRRTKQALRPRVRDCGAVVERVVVQEHDVNECVGRVKASPVATRHVLYEVVSSSMPGSCSATQIGNARCGRLRPCRIRSTCEGGAGDRTRLHPTGSHCLTVRLTPWSASSLRRLARLKGLADREVAGGERSSTGTAEPAHDRRRGLPQRARPLGCRRCTAT